MVRKQADCATLYKQYLLRSMYFFDKLYVIALICLGVTSLAMAVLLLPPLVLSCIQSKLQYYGKPLLKTLICATHMLIVEVSTTSTTNAATEAENSWMARPEEHALAISIPKPATQLKHLLVQKLQPMLPPWCQ